MKINILRSVICIAFNSVLLAGFAQTQSMQLPIPSENSSVINFTDPANPVLVNLPATQFNVGQNGPIGNPHIETNLRDAYPPINEFYLGQHPMFCQSVVHDAEGNLLFFILDNNIYNRRGVAFLDDMASPQGLLNGDYSFAGSNVISGGSQINTYDFNRFNTGVLLNNISLDPEIVIFPLNSRADCYTYGVLFSVYDYDANSSVRS